MQYALLVGVGQFQEDLGNLSFIEEDINDFYQVLRENFGLLEQNIFTFLNATATYDAVISAVDSICELVEDGDRVILYFSTHGKTVYDSTYLATYDASNSDVNATHGWISTLILLTKLHNKKCNVLVFLDSCHSTQYFVTRGPSDIANLCEIKSDPANGYMVVFAAAGEGQKAYPDSEFCHGCWSYYLLNALSGNAVRAFCGNTQRITMNSLQAYLKESVYARIKDVFNTEQTPHVWGTFSDDVLIIEHSIAEEQDMKIKDIYFGEIDADTERSSVPSADFIVKNFYDLNSICSKLNTNNRIQVIIGNKGTGKTYLGEFLEASNDKMIYQSIGAISPAEIQKITTAQADERGKYVDGWLYALYTILACVVVQKKKAGWQEFHSLLQNIYGNEADLIVQQFELGKKLLLNKRIKNGVKLTDSFSIYNNENGTTSVAKLVLLYSFLFNKHYVQEQLYFLLDGLDEQIRGGLSDKQKTYLLDLLEAVEQSHKALTSVKIVLLFRHDILQAISGEANLNKIFTARSCALSWLSINTNFKETPLYQLIDKRVVTSAEAHGKKINLSNILPPKMNAYETWDWILDLTTYTPRDIVAFFNCCKELAGDERCLSSNNLWDATRNYSDYLWMEFQDVLAGTSLAGKEEQLLILFNKIALHHNIRTGRTKFPFSVFQSIYSEIPEFQDLSVLDALKVLYESGMMCIHTTSGTYWNFRENPLPFNADIWKGASFDIHKGLWKKLHIW